MEKTASNRRGFFAGLAAVVAGGFGAKALSAQAPVGGGDAAPAGGQGGGRGRGGRGGGGGGGRNIHNGVLYISGIGAHIPYQSGGQAPATDIAAHTTKVMDQIKRTVEGAGGSMDTILKLNVYLASMYHYEPMNDVYKTYFPNGGPARTCVVVAGIPDDSLLEIDGFAAVPNPPAAG